MLSGWGCQGAASDIPFYDNFLLQKVSASKILDDVIVCDLWFGPPLLIKNPGYTYALQPASSIL